MLKEYRISEDILISLVQSNLELNAIGAKEEGGLSIEEDAYLWCEELNIPKTKDYEIIAKAFINKNFGTYLIMKGIDVK